MADAEDQLRRMVMTFRVSELQMLLGYAGKNKTGRKNELQSRAIEIVRLRNPAIQAKIKELYKSIQLEMMSFGDRSQAAAGGPTGIHPAQKVPMGLGSITAYTQSASVPSLPGVSPSHTNTRYSSSPAVAGVSAIPSATGYTSLTSNSHNSSFPINPDVKLKKLPFYDILGELLKPSSLAPQGSGRYQESTFSFSLTPQQANRIANSRDLRPGRQDYSVQVQMRFCLLETTCEQEDNFPPNIAVKINEKMCPLPTPIPTNKPGVEPKRPSRPVNVTALCRISPTVTNRIQVSWASEYGRCYVISVYLVQKLTSDDLLQRLKNKGAKIADFTRSLTPIVEEVSSKKKSAEPEIITLTDSEDDDDTAPPPAKRPANGQTTPAPPTPASSTAAPGSTTPQGSAPIVEEVSSKKKSAEPEIITLTDSEDDDDTAPPPAKRPANGQTTPAPPTPASSTAAPGSTTPQGSEGTKSNDSWCVGEVDPGKRLVFRKSLSCSLNGTGGLLTPAGGGSSGTTFSPPSSGSVSPQVICLDSPASSPSPPLRRPNQGPSPLPAGISVTPVVSTPAVTSSSTSFASGHSDVRQVINVTSRSTPPVTASSNSSSSSSPVPHATITPVPSTTSSSATISTPSPNASSFLTPSPQDPLATSSSFNLPQTSSAAAAAAAAAVAAAGLTQSPFSLPPALQNLFNPLGMMPPTTPSGNLPFRPQDRFL
ncbi:E3 SUMO-protein ligase PIAS2-like [Penaeus indicus]|uniref:E3 SUMO-protein ligase PIAS2-like n=1 Tax=Penaeus indicus TaxID=29960 RepID=UPI00300D2CD2